MLLSPTESGTYEVRSRSIFIGIRLNTIPVGKSVAVRAKCSKRFKAKDELTS